MRFELILTNNTTRGFSSGGRRAILGDGDIVSDTPAALERFLIINRIPPGTEIHLNSRGGDVDGGLEMGRIIRTHQLNTWVGGYNQWAHRSFKQMAESTGHEKYPGYCISSCTFAFLGGVERRIDSSGDIYAVHQVKIQCVNPNLEQGQEEDEAKVSSCITVTAAQKEIQSILGKIIDYVIDMGVNPKLIVEMVKADPETVNKLSTDQMLQYKIITQL